MTCLWIMMVTEVDPEQAIKMTVGKATGDIYLKNFFFIVTIIVGYGDPSYVP